ncbi:MAG TPA: hypothetical protein VK595_12700, partial [Vicinamibacterales bacterium]|nr:hypothetical protein [Vicinamibacterales bacterium]
ANAVTRGPITVEGDGAAAFIRVKLDVNDYVMRSPDLAPPAAGVRGARVRAGPDRKRRSHPRAGRNTRSGCQFPDIPGYRTLKGDFHLHTGSLPKLQHC